MESTNNDPAAREHMMQTTNVDAIFDNINGIINKLDEMMQLNSAMDTQWWSSQIFELVGEIAASSILGAFIGKASKAKKTAEGLLDLGRYKPKGTLEEDIIGLHKQFGQSDRYINKLVNEFAEVDGYQTYATTVDQINMQLAQDQKSLNEFMKLHGDKETLLKNGNTSFKNIMLEKNETLEAMTEQLESLRTNGVYRPLEKELFSERLLINPLLDGEFAQLKLRQQEIVAREHPDFLIDQDYTALLETDGGLIKRLEQAMLEDANISQLLTTKLDLLGPTGNKLRSFKTKPTAEQFRRLQEAEFMKAIKQPNANVEQVMRKLENENAYLDRINNMKDGPSNRVVDGSIGDMTGRFTELNYNHQLSKAPTAKKFKATQEKKFNDLLKQDLTPEQLAAEKAKLLEENKTALVSEGNVGDMTARFDLLQENYQRGLMQTAEKQFEKQIKDLPLDELNARKTKLLEENRGTLTDNQFNEMTKRFNELYEEFKEKQISELERKPKPKRKRGYERLDDDKIEMKEIVQEAEELRLPEKVHLLEEEL